MATDLIVPNLHKDSEPSLQELEAMIGPGVLPEHRAILLKALTQTSGRALFEALASMPNVGEDSDFAPNRG
jgi:plasmid stability protein